MEWLERFSDQVIGLDTAPIIYFIEENSTYFKLIQPFFKSLAKGRFSVVTSTITLLEVLVQPFRHSNLALAQKYKEILLTSDHITVSPLLNEISEESAKLRGKYNINTPDAIQIATAIHAGAINFLTNDIHLKNINEIEVIILDDLISKN